MKNRERTVLLIEFLDGRIEIVDIPGSELNGEDWRIYVLKKLQGRERSLLRFN